MSYGNAGLNKVAKDNSGFTENQRHDIIMATLTEFGKGTQAFQLRWRENSGEYLTGDILLKTPMFWFMKYKWSRQEIETLFFKARVVIDEKFDRALQQTFGGDPGPRWKGGGGVRKKNWKRVDDEHENRDWVEGDDEKQLAQDDTMEYKINHPNFEYNPVVQPVDFQATGGVNNKDKDSNNKQYGKPDWERLKKNENPPKDYSKWKEPSGKIGIFQIYIQCPNGKTLTLNVEPDEPLHYIKKQIEIKSTEKYDENKQILYFNGAELINNSATLNSYGISNGSTLQLSMGPIKVFIEKKDGQQLELQIDPHASIAKLKKEIEKNTYPSIAANEQEIFSTKQCNKENEFSDNSKTLFKYGIRENDILYLGGPTVWRAPTGNNSYPIFVQCPDGKTLTLNVTSDDDIGYTKLQIQTITNNKYPINKQQLFFKTKELINNNVTLSDENICKNDILQLSNGNIPIYVQTRDGKILNLMVNPYEKIENIKAIIENKTGGPSGDYPIAEQQLFNKLNAQELSDNNKTIFNYGIVANSELYLGGTIPIAIRNISDGTITNLEIDPNKPTHCIKELLEKKENGNIPIRQQTLIFNKQELNDNKPSSYYNICKNNVIDLKLTYPIFIEKPDGKQIKLHISPDDNILSIKQRIENKTIPSIPIAAQTLIFNKQELNNNKPSSYYNIIENSVLKLQIDNDDPETLLEKILSRDAPYIERLDAINKINNNLLKKNPKYNVLLASNKIPLLLCGYSVQVLDEDYNRNPISKTAIETIPNIFNITSNKDNDLAIGSLDETLDSLFKIYDDPKCRKLHPYTKNAINKIVDNIIQKNDPKSINKLIDKLGEKVDIENINTPQVRKFAMEQLQKVMFPKDNKLLNKIFTQGANLKQLPQVVENDLAKKGTNCREWFDIAINEKEGPTKQIGDKHRDLVAKAISEMITDPNPNNKQIGLNLADLFNQKNQNWKNRLDGHSRPIYMKWKFGPLKDYKMKLPPKGPQKKYKVDPLEPTDYRIKQQQDLTIGAPSAMPDL